MSELTGHVKQLEKVVEALKKVDKATSSEGDVLNLLTAALSALDGLDVPLARQAVVDLQALAREAVEQQVATRRQDLEHAARAAGLTYRKRGQADNRLSSRRKPPRNPE